MLYRVGGRAFRGSKVLTIRVSNDFETDRTGESRAFGCSRRECEHEVGRGETHQDPTVVYRYAARLTILFWSTTQLPQIVVAPFHQKGLAHSVPTDFVSCFCSEINEEKGNVFSVVRRAFHLMAISSGFL